MNWKPHPLFIIGLAATTMPIVAHAKIYVSMEQAQKILIPNKPLSKNPTIITDELQDKMHSASSVRQAFQGDRIWRATDGSWFIVDEVVGKHEMITYAVALSPSGAVTGIEILDYVESYGYEVAEAQWRNQFVGKTASDPIKLNQDIQNIGGATLSCKHLTDGVKRVAVLYEIALKNQSQAPKAK
ncbi:FMN-binding protein [Polynucleobacter necessarius]|uniref:FMN-binding protein n=1 Tax=Polynucleobacter necessarius TaxID=576610 RepID=UPI000E096533|nr:FMN-binding protein [Polynucleobacter necessarius]